MFQIEGLHDPPGYIIQQPAPNERAAILLLRPIPRGSYENIRSLSLDTNLKIGTQDIRCPASDFKSCEVRRDFHNTESHTFSMNIELLDSSIPR